MSIMQRLANQVPRVNRRVERNPMYQITKSYMPEIEEAKSAGYSWNQIGKAISEECKELGKWNSEWNFLKIQDMYRAIKGEIKTNEVLA